MAGDLFHDNKPSRKTMQRAMELLRDYCLGPKEIEFAIHSNQNENFHDKYAAAPRLLHPALSSIAPVPAPP